jgi:hypothetical protein
MKWVAVTALTLLAASPAAAQPPECVTLEDFAKAKPGEFPTDWKPRKDAGDEHRRDGHLHGRVEDGETHARVVC